MAGPSRLADGDFIYAMRLQLQEAGAADVPIRVLLDLAPQPNSPGFDADISVAQSLFSSDAREIRNETAAHSVSVRETGASSLKPEDAARGSPHSVVQTQDCLPGVAFKCPICLEYCPYSTSLKLGDCNEQFCSFCIRKYLTVTVKENRQFPIPCPLCAAPLDPERCLTALAGTDAHDVLDRLIVEKLHVSRLRYCVNPECGVAFDWVEDETLCGHVDEFQVECPMCSVSSCVKCKVKWHDGMSCEAYRQSKRNDDALAKLAQRNDWMPCPKCSELIERRRGDCNYVKCRCGTAFCYNCGVEYVSANPTANNQHGKPGCRCGLFHNANANNRDRRNRLIRNAFGMEDREVENDAPGPAAARDVRVGAMRLARNPPEDVPHPFVRGAIPAARPERARIPPGGFFGPDRVHVFGDRPIQGYALRQARNGNAPQAAHRGPLHPNPQDGMIHGELDIASWVRGMRQKRLAPKLQFELGRNACPYEGCTIVFANTRSLEQHLMNTPAHPVWICCGRPFVDFQAYGQHRRNSYNHTLK